MAVSLPTAADVRKAREQAAKSAAERVEVARTPLFAMLGASEAAVTAMTKAVLEANKAVVDTMVRATEATTGATVKAGEQAGQMQQRLAELPHRMAPEELRKFLEELRVQLEKVYAGFAERGEQAWEQWRNQPQFQQAVTTLKGYTEKLDAHVDTLVEEARGAGEKALGTVSRQTRSAGERVARRSQRFSAHAARTVTEVSEEAAKAVAETGAEVAEAISTGGDEVAHEARSVSRKAANRTAPAATPRTPAAKAAARKPAVRRTGDSSAKKS